MMGVMSNLANKEKRQAKEIPFSDTDHGIPIADSTIDWAEDLKFKRIAEAKRLAALAEEYRLRAERERLEDLRLRELYGSCDCSDPGVVPHPCPYAADARGDYGFNCNCCDDCACICGGRRHNKISRRQAKEQQAKAKREAESGTKKGCTGGDHRHIRTAVEAQEGERSAGTLASGERQPLAHHPPADRS